LACFSQVSAQPNLQVARRGARERNAAWAGDAECFISAASSAGIGPLASGTHQSQTNEFAAIQFVFPGFGSMFHDGLISDPTLQSCAMEPDSRASAQNPVRQVFLSDPDLRQFTQFLQAPDIWC